MNTSSAMPSFTQRLIRLLRHPAVRELFRRLLRVVIGLSVLAGIALAFAWWMMHGTFEMMKVTDARDDLAELQTLTLMFREHHQRLPTEKEGLAVIMRPPASAQRKLLRDPWGGHYAYEPLPVVRGFLLRSLGPDKKSRDDDIVLTWP